MGHKESGTAIKSVWIALEGRSAQCACGLAHSLLSNIAEAVVAFVYQNSCIIPPG